MMFHTQWRDKRPKILQLCGLCFWLYLFLQGLWLRYDSFTNWSLIIWNLYLESYLNIHLNTLLYISLYMIQKKKLIWKLLGMWQLLVSLITIRCLCAINKFPTVAFLLLENILRKIQGVRCFVQMKMDTSALK